MSNSHSGFAAFTAFKPRSVAGPSSAPKPAVRAGPALPPNHPTQSSHTSYSYAQPQFNQPYPQTYPQTFPQSNTQSYPQSYQSYATQGNTYGQTNSTYDPEAEAQNAQWQAAYASRDANVQGSGQKPGAANSGPSPPDTTAGASSVDEKKMTVKRKGGGKSWVDDSLLEWNPAHFRIFVGNLAGEVTDDSLFKGFSHFASVEKARVIRDKHTTKSKGFGFVAFSNSDDYFKASLDMQGKYIGSHPVIIRKAVTDIKPVAVRQDKGRKNSSHQDGPASDKATKGSANTGAGVKKKPAKSRNGLKILG